MGNIGKPGTTANARMTNELYAQKEYRRVGPRPEASLAIRFPFTNSLVQ
jgi:hypothetical protein